VTDNVITLEFKGLRPWQRSFLENRERFNVLVVHRRGGKTVLAILWLIMEVMGCKNPRPRGAYIAPLFRQAKAVSWDYLKTYSRGIPGVQFNESELRAIYPNGAEIRLLGSGEADSLRGLYLDAVAADEFADWTASAWQEVVRPALSDRKGSALIIGTVRGRANAFYDAYMNAEDAAGWHRELLKPEDTDALDPDELKQLEQDMDSNAYAQELRCDWDAGMKGSYFGKVMTDAEQEGRVGDIPHDASLPVHVSLDIGVSNSTVAWFWQLNRGRVRAIDLAEYRGTGLPAIVKDIKSRDYNWGEFIVPHDARVQEWGSGATRMEALRELGIYATIAPMIKVQEGIDALRTMLERTEFDREKCFRGIEALKTYRAEYNEDAQVFALKPKHSWESDFADAARYFCVSLSKIGEDRWGGELDYSQINKAVI
jgi:phage terminase large subunit